MGFFGKIKQMLGIGTVKVQIETSPSFSVEAGVINGKLNITGKSDQEILSFEVKLEEVYSTGSGDNKTSKTYTLGTIKLPGKTIKGGEVINVDFSLPFSYSKSTNEQMSEKGGIVGGLGKLGKLANNEKSTFQIVATADVKGATFDPNDVKTLKREK